MRSYSRRGVRSHSTADRVEWDDYHIENGSLWLDVKVLILTALAVVRTPRYVE